MVSQRQIFFQHDFKESLGNFLNCTCYSLYLQSQEDVERDGKDAAMYCTVLYGASDFHHPYFLSTVYYLHILAISP